MDTPEEYAGAQTVVFNAETANGVDPYDPNLTHEANLSMTALNLLKNFT